MQSTIDRLIINSPYEEPTRHWHRDPVTKLFSLEDGRRAAGYVVASANSKAFDDPGIFVEIPLVNEIRPRIKDRRGASDTRVYPWGDVAPNCSLTNFWPVPQACVGDTTSVCSYPAGASPHSALDMAGNVLEWVNDWQDDGYHSVSPSRNPPGPAWGQYRTWRGGSWSWDQGSVRAANRFFTDSDYRTGLIGFRCAAPADPGFLSF